MNIGSIASKNKILCYPWSRSLLVGSFLACLLPVGQTKAEMGSVKIGDKIADFTLSDPRGESHSLSQSKGTKATVVIFIATRCPYSNAFTHVMAELSREYEEKGVRFIGINANKTEPSPEVQQHASKNGLSFLVLKDDTDGVANRLGAQVTPEVFLLDSTMTVKYHGAVGNSRNPTTKPEEANGDELKAALDAVLNGKPVSVTTTKAFGCTIKR
ncbi:MAG TPA: thioredoxin family protein [Terriglobia bacterium]|nr:thioredoxin family protein [Terriglobia bacterium]